MGNFCERDRTVSVTRKDTYPPRPAKNSFGRRRRCDPLVEQPVDLPLELDEDKSLAKLRDTREIIPGGELDHAEDDNARLYIDVHPTSGNNNTRVAFRLERLDF